MTVQSFAMVPGKINEITPCRNGNDINKRITEFYNY